MLYSRGVIKSTGKVHRLTLLIRVVYIIIFVCLMDDICA